MQIRIHYVLFGLFSIIYVILTELETTNDEKRIAIAMGGLLIVAGIWGLFIGEALLKLPPSVQKYSKVINILQS